MGYEINEDISETDNWSINRPNLTNFLLHFIIISSYTNIYKHYPILQQWQYTYRRKCNLHSVMFSKITDSKNQILHG